jgi:hypothetical protein
VVVLVVTVVPAVRAVSRRLVVRLVPAVLAAMPDTVATVVLVAPATS